MRRTPARKKVRWNHKSQRLHAKAGTAGHDEVAQTQQRFVIFPRWDVKKRVRAQQKIKMRICPMKLLLEMPDRLHRVIHLAAGMSRARLGERRDETRMVRAG